MIHWFIQLEQWSFEMGCSLTKLLLHSISHLPLLADLIFYSIQNLSQTHQVAAPLSKASSDLQHQMTMLVSCRLAQMLESLCLLCPVGQVTNHWPFCHAAKIISKDPRRKHMKYSSCGRHRSKVPEHVTGWTLRLGRQLNSTKQQPVSEGQWFRDVWGFT